MTTSPTTTATLRAVTRQVPPVDLVDVLADGDVAWLAGGAGLVATGVVAHLAPGDVAATLAAIEVEDPCIEPGTGPVAIGALAFDPVHPGELVLPARVLRQTPDGRAFLTELERVGEQPERARVPPSRLAFDARPTRARWRAIVSSVLDSIARGELEKVVLARSLFVEADAPFDATTIARRLHLRERDCFTYVCDGLVGSSPELLVRRNGSLVQSRPLAGTATPNASSGVDELVSSPKEAHEHRLVVDAVRVTLEPCCSELEVVQTPGVQRFASLSHLSTPIVGRLAQPWPSALDLARMLHPTPAVGGTPTDVALATLARLEELPRGRYAGPVGWVDARGDGEWAVALRGATLDGTRARLVAGAGIVAGSDPDQEWEETEAKLEPMLVALLGM